MVWTVNQVKEQLPLVKVEVSKKKTVSCITAGRRNQFCSVYNAEQRSMWEFSWESVTRSLNTNQPLLL